MVVPVVRTASGVIAFTVPAVPTGMKAGVGTSPCAVLEYAGPRGAVCGNDAVSKRHHIDPPPPLAGGGWGEGAAGHRIAPSAGSSRQASP